MRARHRVLLAVLIASVSVAVSPVHSTVPSATVALETHNCPNGTAWDNFLRRCV
ncbi:MAG TPA: hypothetical protein VF657_06115 [Actinoplanes sp.]|jgi:hypothetical protein